jgi:hypothetical protein
MRGQFARNAEVTDKPAARLGDHVVDFYVHTARLEMQAFNDAVKETTDPARKSCVEKTFGFCAPAADFCKAQ